MPVRYTDFGGDTGSTPDRQEEDLLHPDYHRGTVLGGGFPGRSVPTEGKDDFHWKEPVWGERDAAGGMRPRAGGEGKASIWPAFPFKVRYHGALLRDTVFGMPPQHMEHEAYGARDCANKRRGLFL